MWKVAAIMLNNKAWTGNKWWSSNLGAGKGEVAQFLDYWQRLA
jgi:hypothetical protein